MGFDDKGNTEAMTFSPAILTWGLQSVGGGGEKGGGVAFDCGGGGGGGEHDSYACGVGGVGETLDDGGGCGG